jgi:hypothetical protein
MTDDLYDRFRRAADPGGRRPRTTPAELLARARRDRRRHRILASGGGTAVAAVTAGALVLGFGAWRGSDGDQGTDGPPVVGTDQRSAGGPAVPLDRGPLTEARTQQVLSECVAQLQVGDPSDFDVDLARRYDDYWRAVDVVVASAHDGKHVIHCTGEHNVNGISVEASTLDNRSLGGMPAPDPDADRPLVAYKPWEYGFSCEQSVNVRITTEGVWKAAETVDRVEIRVVEPGGRQPWRSSRVHDGFVYWSGWSEEVLEGKDVLQVAWRAYDTDGNLIDADLMPLESRQKRIDPETLRFCENP